MKKFYVYYWDKSGRCSCEEFSSRYRAEVFADKCKSNGTFHRFVEK